MANSWTLLNIYYLEHLIGDSLIKLSAFFFPFLLLVWKGYTFALTWTKKVAVLKIFL